MYIFNPIYKFHYDIQRIVIIDDIGFGGGNVKAFIHPVYAWILNLFDGNTSKETAVQIIVNTLNLTEKQAYDIVNPFICNPKELYIKYDGVISTIPANILIPVVGTSARNRLPDDFFTSVETVNHKDIRMYRPMNLLICPTLRCYTDCVYCYANRKFLHEELSAQQWVQIIDNAKRDGIERIDVTGGEFFMKKGWQEILSALYRNGFKPEISTKIPLDRNTLDDIKAYGLGCIQYSLDTLDSDLAVHTLKVNDKYIRRLLDSIKYADSIGLDIIIKPTLCKQTCNAENLNNIIDFCAGLKHVRRVVVTAIGYSCFKPKGNYELIRPDFNQITELRDCMSRLQSVYKFPIIDDTFVFRSYNMRSYDEFMDRAICTANIDGFVILPDGTATLCEELYWHPTFIIGDAKNMTVPQIWNSPAALRLTRLDKSDFPEYSNCKRCNDFSECRSIKGVCWKLIIAAYGAENEFQADPRCSEAPDAGTHFLIP